MSSASVPHKARRKIPVWLGNAIEIIGLAYGFLSFFLINQLLYSLPKLMVLLVSWFCFWFFSHCLAHFAIGKILGVNFLYYFVSKSSLTKLDIPIISFLAKLFPVLGIKIDRSTFKSISPKKKAMVYASGTLASMISPMVCLIYAVVYLENWMGAFLSLITAGNIVFTLIFSAKVGDLSKARNSLRVSYKSNI